MTAIFKRSRGALNALAAVVLAMASAGAIAEVWIEPSRNDDYLAYGDLSSIRREGDLVKMWSMFDYRSPQPAIAGKTYLSTRRQFEYNCKGGGGHARWRSRHTRHARAKAKRARRRA